MHSEHLMLTSLLIIHMCDANSGKSFVSWELYRQRAGGSQPAVESHKHNSALAGLELLLDHLSLILIFFHPSLLDSCKTCHLFLEAN